MYRFGGAGRRARNLLCSRDCQKWLRLDARGNKEGVNAQFSVETEQLAFAVRPEMGEEDDFIVYPDKLVRAMRNSTHVISAMVLKNFS